MRIAACCAGLTQERNHLRRTWLLGAQKGGFVHAYVFSEPEACRWLLIQTERWILVDRPPRERPSASPAVIATPAAGNGASAEAAGPPELRRASLFCTQDKLDDEG